MVTIAERMMAQAAQQASLTTPADFTVVDGKTFERLSRDELVMLGLICKTSLRMNSIGSIYLVTAARPRAGAGATGLVGQNIFWQGPLGVCEIDLFCEGSRFWRRS